jgi:hypothetical protein
MLGYFFYIFLEDYKVFVNDFSIFQMHFFTWIIFRTLSYGFTLSSFHRLKFSACKLNIGTNNELPLVCRDQTNRDFVKDC